MEAPLNVYVPDRVYDVVCVGAGITGLYNCKYMKHAGLTSVALEAEPDIGGVWRFKKTPGGVIKSTITTSSLTVTEASDFPLRVEHETDFPSHWQFFEYLKSYIKHFEIEDRIVCDAKVECAEKIDGIWNVTDVHGRVWKGKNLNVAAGANTTPNIPRKLEEMFREFKGHMEHASVYKEPDPKYERKKVLIIGGGETGADIATELSFFTERLYLSIPNGQWFGTRKGGFAKSFPLEHFSSRARRTLLNGAANPDLYWGLKFYTETKGGFHGHGIECWRSPYDRYATSFINKNTEVLSRIDLGRVVPKPAVAGVDGNVVRFTDGTCAEFDMVMFCTGYKFGALSWLKFPTEEMANGFCVSKCFKMCIHPLDTSLAFFGFARPVRGSIPSAAEMQTWMYSWMLSGKLQFPSTEEMQRVAAKERKERIEYFNGANTRTVTLCELYDYNDDLAKLMGVYPNYQKLLKEVGLKQWLKFVIAPFHTAQYRINEPGPGRDYYIANCERFLPRAPSLIILFSIITRCIFHFLQFVRSPLFWPVMVLLFCWLIYF